MGYSWFRVDAAIVDHPKVMALATMLGDLNALAYVIRLWSWTQRYAPTGRFRAEIVDHVERAMGWQGERGILITSVQKVGLLEAHGGEFEVHDWHDQQGSLVEKSNRDAILKRKKRRTNGANAARAEIAPGARTAPARDETRRDETNETDDLLQGPLLEHEAHQYDALRKDAHEISSGSAFVDVFAARRRLKLNALGRPWKPEDTPADNRLDQWFHKAVDVLGGPPDGVAKLLDTLDGYLDDTHWQAKGLPFSGYIEQWQQHTEMVRQLAARQRKTR